MYTIQYFGMNYVKLDDDTCMWEQYANYSISWVHFQSVMYNYIVKRFGRVKNI